MDKFWELWFGILVRVIFVEIFYFVGSVDFVIWWGVLLEICIRS